MGPVAGTTPPPPPPPPPYLVITAMVLQVPHDVKVDDEVLVPRGSYVKLFINVQVTAATLYLFISTITTATLRLRFSSGPPRTLGAAVDGVRGEPTRTIRGVTPSQGLQPHTRSNHPDR